MGAARDRRPDPSPPTLRVISGDKTEPSRRSILIVDDDTCDAILVRALLRKAAADATIEICSSIGNAEREILRGGHDAVLVDHRLGPMTGAELIERCRSQGCRVPLILLAGHGGLDVDLEAMRVGAADSVSKSEMTPRVLERTLRYAIERHATATALLASQRRFEAAVAGSNDGIWDWNVQRDELYLSERFKHMLSADQAPLISTVEAWHDVVHPEDRAGLRAAILDHLEGFSDSVSTEYRVRRGDQRWGWMRLRGLAQRDSTGRVERIAGSQSDITALKKAEEDAQQRALHDPLTGLANRVLLEERIRQCGHRRQREQNYRLALLYIDLDGFKPVNDRLGHLAGDQVLRQTAERLRTLVRPMDCIARVGGDEFVILLDGCGRKADAKRVADDVESALEQPFECPEGVATIGASVGVVVVQEDWLEVEDLLARADQSMYARKSARRGSLRRNSGDPEHALVEDLRRGLSATEFQAYFQPVFSRASKIVSYESLARWKHGQRGLVMPSDFIDLAERYDLVVNLGNVMLGLACAWAVRHHGQWAVAVNVSPGHLCRPTFLADVESALERTGLESHRLRLELTEHVAWVEDRIARENLLQLREYGVAIDLDDFGTGYSSAELLVDLPFSSVKIDRSIVRDIETCTRRQCLVGHLVRMAHDLGMTVTAEGIETGAAWATVRSLGVDAGQGYHLSRPAVDPMLSDSA